MAISVVETFKSEPDVFTVSIHQKDLWPRTGFFYRRFKI